MKLKQTTKRAIGISAVFSAVMLSFTFIVLAIRKKSILEALIAVLAMVGATAGSLLVIDDLFGPDQDATLRAVNAVAPEAVEEELFDGEEIEEAELHMRHILGGGSDGELAKAPSLRPTVPQDEEATEADFM